jgi:hypothetical protein
MNKNYLIVTGVNQDELIHFYENNGLRNDKINIKYIEDVDLSNIQNNEIYYSFLCDNTLSYDDWFNPITRLFSNLAFRLAFSCESDDYDMIYIYDYKNGVKKLVNQYSSISKNNMEENINNAIEEIVTYLIKNKIFIKDIYWIDYCKSYICKNENKKYYEEDLFIIVMYQLNEFVKKCTFHHSLFTNHLLWKSFVEKVKNM